MLYVDHMLTWCPWKSAEGAGYPGTRAVVVNIIGLGIEPRSFPRATGNPNC